MSAGKHKYEQLIKARAESLGFLSCGISVACRLEDEAGKMEQWLQEGMHGSMRYMENHFEKRVDPRKLVHGAKSVISVLYNYFPAEIQKDPSAPVLSKYAYGNDYHFILKEKLRQLLKFMNEAIGKVNGEIFVDSAPVMERAWAARSGIGWIGKNTNLIVKGGGSFFFIGELIVDIELPADSPAEDRCGSCTRCMDACPTGALVAPRLLDARRCISYLTIEYRNSLPSDMSKMMENRVFGCDICQDVCPHNRKARPHGEPLFNPAPGLLEMTREQWHDMERDHFNRYFGKSAVRRTGYKQLRRNLDFLLRKSKPGRTALI